MASNIYSFKILYFITKFINSFQLCTLNYDSSIALIFKILPSIYIVTGNTLPFPTTLKS